MANQISNDIYAAYLRDIRQKVSILSASFWLGRKYFVVTSNNSLEYRRLSLIEKLRSLRAKLGLGEGLRHAKLIEVLPIIYKTAHSSEQSAVNAAAVFAKFMRSPQRRVEFFRGYMSQELSPWFSIFAPLKQFHIISHPQQVSYKYNVKSLCEKLFLHHPEIDVVSLYRKLYNTSIAITNSLEGIRHGKPKNFQFRTLNENITRIEDSINSDQDDLRALSDDQLSSLMEAIGEEEVRLIFDLLAFRDPEAEARLAAIKHTATISQEERKQQIAAYFREHGQALYSCFYCGSGFIANWCSFLFQAITDRLLEARYEGTNDKPNVRMINPIHIPSVNLMLPW